MLLRFGAPLLFAIFCSGCSYGYKVKTVGVGERISFVVDPASNAQPKCVRQVRVDAVGDAGSTRQTRTPPPGEFRETMWLESVEHGDSCVNRFPLDYGQPLAGRPRKGVVPVPPKPLTTGTIYTVQTTTGATGYGGAAFILHEDGSIEEMP